MKIKVFTYEKKYRKTIVFNFCVNRDNIGFDIFNYGLWLYK